MHWFSRPLEVPRRLRAIVRARESSVIVLALIVGALAGLVIAAMGEAVALMHLTELPRKLIQGLKFQATGHQKFRKRQVKVGYVRDVL
jgi:hypothetical protein